MIIAIASANIGKIFCPGFKVLLLYNFAVNFGIRCVRRVQLFLGHNRHEENTTNTKSKLELNLH